jgi:hypothetical protein
LNTFLPVFRLLLSVLPLAFVGVVVYLLVHKPSGPTRLIAPNGPLSWEARMSAPGAMLLMGGRGRIDIVDGVVHFGSSEPDQAGWSVAATSVHAGLKSVMWSQEIWFESPVTGRIDLAVSREHINSFMRNDFKHMRERNYAREFLAALQLAGATVV